MTIGANAEFAQVTAFRHPLDKADTRSAQRLLFIQPGAVRIGSGLICRGPSIACPSESNSSSARHPCGEPKPRRKSALRACPTAASHKRVAPTGRSTAAELPGYPIAQTPQQMSAGLPFALALVMGLVIMIIWTVLGPGPNAVRRAVAVGIIVALTSCWMAVIRMGSLTDSGSLAMGPGFVISVLSLFVPMLWRKILLLRSYTLPPISSMRGSLCGISLSRKSETCRSPKSLSLIRCRWCFQTKFVRPGH